MKIVFKHAVYTDINTQGEACRPVAIVTDKQELNKAEDLLLAWQQFAEFAEHKRAAGLSPAPSQIYLPVPPLLKDVSRFTIGAFESSTTVNFLREDILRKIDKKLNQLRKVKNRDPLTITELELDRELIGRYPAATGFRRRTTGYKDILVDLHTNTDSDERYRIGAHGVIIAGHSLTHPDAYDINTGEKHAVSRSCYDMISPVRCSIFAGSHLYLMKDIEDAKKARNTVSQQNLKENRRQTCARRRDKDWLEQHRIQREEMRLKRIVVVKEFA
ncbi:hypothetical protein ID855_06040 [Xenorhabdus sp. ZM]|uniref:hypothetical protein n=1 Tax=Xenorhabdus szentirmaii TaxID=290112 RepID=UPI0019BF8AE6|nr:hypothetical protein [Xenorhabdus sp. ZM]MBD2804264.1 hypothetical protein [Xenorhabdus sp. ZM]